MVHGGEGVLKTSVWDKEPLSSITNYLHSFDPTLQSQTKKPEPTPDLPPVGSVIPGAATHTRTHTRTHTHVCHGDRTTPADRMGRQDPAAGMRGKTKRIV